MVDSEQRQAGTDKKVRTHRGCRRPRAALRAVLCTGCLAPLGCPGGEGVFAAARSHPCDESAKLLHHPGKLDGVVTGRPRDWLAIGFTIGMNPMGSSCRQPFADNV